MVEFEDVSRKLDIVIMAEKGGFVDNYEQLIKMKDLRNESHNIVLLQPEVAKAFPAEETVNKVLKFLIEADRT